MGRGAKKAEERRREEEFKAREAARKEEAALREKVFGAAQAEAQAIPTDLTPEEREGIRRARIGGIDIGYGNLFDTARRRYAQSGSQAGFSELLAELGRERAREKSRGSAELEQYFAEVPVRRRLARAGIYVPLSGQSTGLYGSLLNPATVYTGGGPSTLDRILGGAATAASFLPFP